ncbi:MAG: hypothetical protein O3C40_33000, partial [Planctomycetota bacterium]|nr:hypothetical protein [Planctomycetota bacterium]
MRVGSIVILLSVSRAVFFRNCQLTTPTRIHHHFFTGGSNCERRLKTPALGGDSGVIEKRWR